MGNVDSISEREFPNDLAQRRDAVVSRVRFHYDSSSKCSFFAFHAVVISDQAINLVIRYTNKYLSMSLMIQLCLIQCFNIGYRKLALFRSQWQGLQLGNLISPHRISIKSTPLK